MNEPGKRVSWVELYLDLVFVLAVGQLAHLLVAHPDMRHVWIVLGLFFVLWWTWVGFTVSDINLKVLQLSGGSPSMARAIFAVGHMLPAFALLLIAAGLGLLLEGDPPSIAPDSTPMPIAHSA